MKDCNNEDERATFYMEVGRILAAVHDLQFVSSHIEGDAILDDFSYGLVVEKIESEIRNVTSRLDQKLSRFPSDADCFPSIYTTVGNLQSIMEVFLREQARLSRIASDALDSASSTMKAKIDEYIDHPSTNLSTDGVVSKLLILKQASTDIACWSQVINKVIDQFIDSVLSRRFLDASSFLLELSVALRSNDSPIALRLLEDHRCFAGAANAMFNEASAGQTIDYVLNGLTVTDEVRKRLQDLYGVFESKYTDLVNEGLNELRVAKESGIHDESEVILDIAKKAKDVAGDYTQTYTDQIVQLTAHLFAGWSLASMDSFSTLSSGHNYLMKPHAAQVIAIWSMLNCGNTKQTNLQNKMLEVKTGEGKSIVLGITAAILSLLGYDVDCICYSSFLSERDWNAFKGMFVAMGVKSSIWYGTYDGVRRKLLHKYWSLSEGVVGDKKPRIAHSGQHGGHRCRVMLIDEVDVFFGPEAYGDTFNPGHFLSSKSISELYHYIWENCESLNHSEIMGLPQTEAILKSYPVFVHGLIKNELTYLKSAAENVKSKNHDYVAVDGKIGVKVSRCDWKGILIFLQYS